MVTGRAGLFSRADAERRKDGLELGLPPRFCVHVARVRLPHREGKLAGLGGVRRSVTGKSEFGLIMIGPCCFCTAARMQADPTRVHITVI